MEAAVGLHPPAFCLFAFCLSRRPFGIIRQVTPADPALWQRARAVFDEVADLGPADRPARVAALCGSDEALRREVESLLAHDVPAADPFGPLVGQAARTFVDAGAPLEPGQTLLHYTLTWKIGVGGMGEVWRATDDTLGRDVAIKLLPAGVAGNPARLARFEREAKLLAALNHANIASVYSLHRDGPVPFLAMEYVDGDDLARRIERGAIPLAEALPIARQIVEAVEEAHEKGIVHRDLKPANVKIRPDGKVKVLDFGLAKALSGDTASGITRDAGTLTAAAQTATRAGLILGTASYMPPEQARGLPVDKRADIWAFGAVLFEMLSGHRAFPGDTMTDVLASVVTSEPDWSRLPAETPPGVVGLLHRCLEKDVRQRLRDIGDARLEIEQVIAGRSGITGSSPRAVTARVPRTLRWPTAALFALAGAALAVLVMRVAARPGPAPSPVQRLNLSIAAGTRLEDVLESGSRQTLAVSRDGALVVYVGRGPGARRQIYRRGLDRVTTEPVEGTEGGDMPFLSPDGQWLGFAAGGQLKKVPIGGGAPIVICEAPEPRGASWGDDDRIVFAPTVSGGLSRVPAAGGPIEVLTSPETARGESGHRWPHVLPGSRGVVFNVELTGSTPPRAIDVMDLETRVRHTLVAGATDARYLDGVLVYGRAGALVAVPFDLARLAVAGSETTVLEDVRQDERSTGKSFADLSPGGTLVFVPGYPRPAQRELVWLDRTGQPTPVATETRPFLGARVAPDGQRLAVVVQESGRSLWAYDLRRQTWSRLTPGNADVDTPSWAPDSGRIFFSWNPRGLRGVYSVPADGSAPPTELALREGWLFDMPSVAPAAPVALLAVQVARGDDLYTLTLDGQHRLDPFLATPANEASPVFSPSGRFVAYTSNESGRREVYIRPFAAPGPKWIVSTAGGTTPRWRGDEREIYYLEGSRLMAAAIAPGASLEIGVPRMLFEDPAFAWSGADLTRYDVTADGQRFLTVRPEPREQLPLQLVVVPRFGDEVRAQLAAAGAVRP
jgi:serine/threonine-protein kinase